MPDHGEYKCKAKKAAFYSVGSGEPWDWKLKWFEADFRKIKLIAVPGPPTAFQLTSLKSQFQCHFFRESSPIPKAWLNAHAIHSHSILCFSFVNLVTLSFSCSAYLPLTVNSQVRDHVYLGLLERIVRPAQIRILALIDRVVVYADTKIYQRLILGQIRRKNQRWFQDSKPF